MPIDWDRELVVRLSSDTIRVNQPVEVQLAAGESTYVGPYDLVVQTVEEHLLPGQHLRRIIWQQSVSGYDLRFGQQRVLLSGPATTPTRHTDTLSVRHLLEISVYRSGGASQPVHQRQLVYTVTTAGRVLTLSSGEPVRYLTFGKVLPALYLGFLTAALYIMWIYHPVVGLICTLPFIPVVGQALLQLTYRNRLYRRIRPSFDWVAGTHHLILPPGVPQQLFDGTLTLEVRYVQPQTERSDRPSTGQLLYKQQINLLECLVPYTGEPTYRVKLPTLPASLPPAQCTNEVRVEWILTLSHQPPYRPRYEGSWSLNTEYSDR